MGWCPTVVIPVLRRSVPGGIDHLPCECSDIQPIQPLDRQYKKGHRESSLGTALRVSTMCLPDGTACDRISQASPVVFAYCKRSTTGGGNGLGTRLAFDDRFQYPVQQSDPVIVPTLNLGGRKTCYAACFFIVSLSRALSHAVQSLAAIWSCGTIR